MEHNETNALKEIVTLLYCKKCGYRGEIIVGCKTTGDIPTDEGVKRRREAFIKNNKCPKCGCKEWVVG